MKNNKIFIVFLLKNQSKNWTNYGKVHVGKTRNIRPYCQRFDLLLNDMFS